MTFALIAIIFGLLVLVADRFVNSAPQYRHFKLLSTINEKSHFISGSSIESIKYYAVQTLS